MIYTVTLNPSLDYVTQLPSLVQGTVNRAESENVYAGGKGINVSIMLSNLGYSSMVLGFIAGITGDTIEAMMNSYGCVTDFIRVQKGSSRINVKIKAKRETDINGIGPVVSAEDVDNLYGQLDKLGDGDVLVLAGSVPPSLPKTIYEDILKMLDGRNIRAVVDAEGELLMNVLKYRPFLVKPNRAELEGIFNVEIKTHESIAWYAKKLQELGARNVLVSMDREGAILVNEEGKALFAAAPKGAAVNSVGAGDSMVAGFIAGYFDSNGNTVHALNLGITAGSATAFKPWIATGDEVRALL